MKSLVAKQTISLQVRICWVDGHSWPSSVQLAAISMLRTGGWCAENVIDPVTALGEDRAAERSGSCIVTPEQTEGPYFVDEQLNRSDIRVDPSSGIMSSGTLLRLGLSISQNIMGYAGHSGTQLSMCGIVMRLGSTPVLRI